MQDKKTDEQVINELEITNKLLLEMAKNQKDSNKNLLKVFIVSVVCYTLIFISMIVGFFVYESQFEYTTTETVTETITQEVSGEDSTINNVDGNQYNDNAIHNEGDK